MIAEMNMEYAPAKIVIGSYEFLNEEYQIESISIKNGCYDGSVVGVGAVYSQSVTIEMSYIEGITKGTQFFLYFYINNSWILQGTFWTDDYPAKNGKRMTLSAHGIIGEYGDKELVFSGSKQTYTLKDVKDKIEYITGYRIIFWPLLDSAATSVFLGQNVCFLKDIEDYIQGRDIHTGISVRTALAGLAILFGGNVFEDETCIRIKAKSYTPNQYSFSKDTYNSDYQYSQFTYALRSLKLSFLPWGLGFYSPPGVNGQICTVDYVGESRVENLLLGSGVQGFVSYDYTIECDWIGWTNDGGTFDRYTPPGGKARGCYIQGDLIYRTGSFSFPGYNKTAIYPGNIICIKVDEETEPINLYCGEIELHWDGGFTTSVSCECSIDSGQSSYSANGSSQTEVAAAQVAGFMNLQKISFADITFSNVKDSTISGSKFIDGSISGSKIADSAITDSKISDSSITGSKFVDGSISGSKIADSAITDSKISDSSITGSKFIDGTIEGAKIKDAEIAFEKVDKSFIADLTSDKAFADILKANVASFGYLDVFSADLRYADISFTNIDLANIDKTNIGLLFNEVGLIDRATIVDGHVTGFLDSVEVNAANITSGTLIADRILLRGSENGLLFALNNMGELVSKNVDTLDGSVLTERTVSADKLIAKSVTSNEIDVENLFAQDIVASGTITGAKLYGTYAEITGGKVGNWELNGEFSSLWNQVKNKYDIFISASQGKIMVNQNLNGGTVTSAGAELTESHLRLHDGNSKCLIEKNGNITATGKIIGGKWCYNDTTNYGLYWSGASVLRPISSSYKPNLGNSSYPMGSIYASNIYLSGYALNRVVTQYAEYSVQGTGNWETWTWTFPTAYKNVPLVSIANIVPTATENTYIASISTTGVTFGIYASNPSWTFKVRVMAIGPV